MKNMIDLILQFSELLEEDSIPCLFFEDLHDVCDPNQYMIDVCGEQTIGFYNDFADQWNQFVKNITV